MVKKFLIFLTVVLVSLSASAASSRGLFVSVSHINEAEYFKFFSTASLVEKQETGISLGFHVKNRLTIYGTMSAATGNEVTSFTRFAGLSKIAGLGAGAGIIYDFKRFSLKTDAGLGIFFPDGDFSNLYSMLVVKICPTLVVFVKQTGDVHLNLSAGLPFVFAMGGCGNVYGAGFMVSIDYCGGLAE